MTQTSHCTPANTELARPHYQLQDSLWASEGVVMLSGTQAILRVALMQRARDAAAGLNTRGFISGYRGSPLGMVDQTIWKQGKKTEESGIEFVPAINEELAATLVLGTQRVESDPERTVDAVFGLWYGKGPGVDRAGDALKHGNAFGSSPHGGVLVVAGDDHGCVSSSMPHQSDLAFMAWHMPVLAPANVSELVLFGLYGYALSRFSGNWVGLSALSEVVESTATVNLDAITTECARWQDAGAVQAATGYASTSVGGLHYRWPDLPSLEIESRMADKLRAVAAFARVNPLDRLVVAAPAAQVGIVTCGKAHEDLMEVLRRLDVSLDDLAAAGVRLYKVGLAFPIEAEGMQRFAAGLSEVLVIEEKAPVVEQQLRSLFYNAPENQRPLIVGKHDALGQPLVSSLGELRPSRLIQIVAHWLSRHLAARKPAATLAAPWLHLNERVVDFVAAPQLSNAADAVRRQAWFCAGCPHNTSTRVPEGSQARAGIGCHFMANWMDRDTEGLIQMGGEGVDWVSHARFTRRAHVFQNLGDGTYYHSGYLAIRQAVAARARITYKILFNDAVAMTGGQPVDGVITVDAIARQVESEGVKQVVVVSDDIDKYPTQTALFPKGTRFHDRSALDAVQRELREVDGVTVLIYEQTCAAEKRRRRKQGRLSNPERRLVIHPGVCEGCGDCTTQSNCVAVQPLETPFGRKRQIDQTACNLDYSCQNGFCPSFVSVVGARPRRMHGALQTQSNAFWQQVAALPLPHTRLSQAPWDLLVTGIGGTGVVTVGAVVAMAAHLQGHSASVLDFMGFAQKGGAVLSFVRLAARREALHQSRIDTQQADAVLACDLVVGASPEALQAIRRDRTRVVCNAHRVPVAASLHDPDAVWQGQALLDKVRYAAGAEQVETMDAQALAQTYLGQTQSSNVIALGYAWQRGLVPVALASLERAIELNGVAVATNRMALALGRMAAAAPEALAAFAPSTQQPGVRGRLQGDGHVLPQAAAAEPLANWLARARAHLRAYQNAAWAERYQRTIDAVAAREQAVQAGSEQLTRTVALSLLRLMSYKDEYEVARLLSDPAFHAQLAEQFEGDFHVEFHLAPPALTVLGALRRNAGAVPRKRRFGPWLKPFLSLLAHGKVLRGTAFDVFGYSHERRSERQLIRTFEQALHTEVLPRLDAEGLAAATQWARRWQRIRGYGHVKAVQMAAFAAHTD